MKKQELIHIHGLLAEVRDQCEVWEGGTFDLAEYRDLGVRPTSIHKSKADHKRAVFELVNGITSAMETEERKDADLERHYDRLLETAASKGHENDFFYSVHKSHLDVPRSSVLKELSEMDDVYYDPEDEMVMVSRQSVDEYIEA